MGHVKPLTYGRMGNFLFQAAAAIAYAKKYGLEFSLPHETTAGRNPKWNPVYLPHLVNPRYNAALPSVTVSEKKHTFQELPFEAGWKRKNIILDGYWQTEKYFKHLREDILRLFGFAWTSRPGTVSVHVRRGDYVKLTNKHPPVTRKWIDEAMSQFPGAHFVFFSDDIPWCRLAYGGRKDCSFSQGKSEVCDLVEMSWCEHHICSCSTFSWWGAWLNQNSTKKIIMPKLWFVPGWGGLDVKDIVPEEWTRL